MFDFIFVFDMIPERAQMDVHISVKQIFPRRNDHFSLRWALLPAGGLYVFETQRICMKNLRINLIEI
jgi:hypothetical protein